MTHLQPEYWDCLKIVRPKFQRSCDVSRLDDGLQVSNQWTIDILSGNPQTSANNAEIWWMEEIRRIISWYGKYPLICRVSYTSRVVQDFFHQQYVGCNPWFLLVSPIPNRAPEQDVDQIWVGKTAWNSSKHSICDPRKIAGLVPSHGYCPPGNDRTSHQSGSSENHHLQECWLLPSRGYVIVPRRVGSQCQIVWNRYSPWN